MATKLYFDIAQKVLTASLVKSDTETVADQMPELVIGDQVPMEVYVVDSVAGGFAPFSGSALYSVRLAIGTPGAVATGGTFTLTYSGQTTTAIAYNASAATVQAALVALSNIGPSDVVVTADGSGWIVEFQGALALTNVAEMTGSASGLTPESAVSVSTVRAGSGSVNERQLVKLTQLPAAFQDTWADITDGWEATLEMNTQGVFDALAGAASVTLYAELELTDENGDRRTYGQIPVLVRNQVIDEDALVPTPRPDYYTAAEIDAFLGAIDNAYVYIAYATDSSGGGFSNTFSTSKTYVAFLKSTTPIVSPIASDFAGLWKYYAGWLVYVAYASDSSGTGFTTTFSADLNYIAIKASATPLTPVSGDFTGLWKKYGGARRWRQRDARAFAFVPNQTDGPEMVTTEVGANLVMVDSLAFDDTTKESAQLSFVLPDIYNLSTIKVKVYWQPASGASPGDKVAWGAAAMAVSNDDVINRTFGTEIEIDDVVLAAGDLHVTAASASITIAGTPALGDMIWLKVSRLPASAEDTMTGDARLIAVVVGWYEATDEPAAW